MQYLFHVRYLPGSPWFCLALVLSGYPCFPLVLPGLPGSPRLSLVPHGPPKILLVLLASSWPSLVLLGSHWFSALVMEEMSEANKNLNNVLNILSMAKAPQKLNHALSKDKKAANMGLKELGKPLNKALQYVIKAQ